MSDYLRFVPDLREKIINIVSVLDVQQNWGISYIDAEEAWKHSRGQNIKIAVVDTGWTPHKDLTKNFIECHDATGNNDGLDHGNYHSSHVTGIIAANCEDRVGVMGVAPDSKFVTIKCLDDTGCGSYDFIVKALEIAHDLDVDIINMSLGSSANPGGEKLHDLIKSIANQGKIIVCASGNDGGDVNYPAKYEETISVAAVQADGTLTKFSSRGPELDTAAPGVQIYSTWGNNEYIKLDGTSMAAPSISGMIALIMSYKKTLNPNYKTNYKDIIKILYKLGEANIIHLNGYNIGVPKFLNYNWNDNA
jgi:subtilisin